MSGSRVRLEVDMGAFSGNISVLCRRVAPCSAVAVLKANAYGTGARVMADAVCRSGVKQIAVANLPEALELKETGAQIQILGPLLPDEIGEAVLNDLHISVDGYASALEVNRKAVHLKKKAICHLKIDTGMGRFGMAAEDAGPEIRRIVALPGLNVTGIFTHLSSADTPGNEFTAGQLQRFVRLLTFLQGEGIVFQNIHAAASNGIVFYPESFTRHFTTVRCGIVMYGCKKNHREMCEGLRPVLSLKSVLGAVRHLKAGDFVGYGHTWRSGTSALVGVVLAGYEDGIPLALSNQGYVLVRGVRCPVIGRVCMDCMMIDLKNVPDPRPGDEVVCVGKDGSQEISFEDWAKLKNTHVHDILCGVGNRVERCYI